MKQTAAEVSVRQIEIADDRCREGLRTRLVICTTGLVSYPAKKLLKLADLQFSGLTAAAHHTQRRYGLQETGVDVQGDVAHGNGALIGRHVLVVQLVLHGGDDVFCLGGGLALE